MGIKMEKEVMKRLAEEALEARKNAYAPYSRYLVGAALLCADGTVYRGCNVENASYGAANCAERTAFFRAVADGARRFSAIAIAGGMEGQEPSEYAFPCGICRQVMQELAGEGLEILVVKSKEEYRVFSLKELLPFGFGGSSIV